MRASLDTQAQGLVRKKDGCVGGSTAAGGVDDRVLAFLAGNTPSYPPPVLCFARSSNLSTNNAITRGIGSGRTR